MDNNTPSIITEQGFVAGEGFGVTPLSESDKEKLNAETEKKDD